MRRSSRRSSTSERRPYPRVSTGTFSSLPSLLLPHARVAQSSSWTLPLVAPAKPRCPASILRTPSRSTSPRASSAPPRARSSPTPAESGVSAAAAIDNHVELHPSPSIPLLRPLSDQIEPAVSSDANPSSFPTLSGYPRSNPASPALDHCRAAVNAVAPPLCPSRAASAMAPAVPPRAPGSPRSPGRRLAPPPRRLAPSRLERRAPPRLCPRAAAGCAACGPCRSAAGAGPAGVPCLRAGQAAPPAGLGPAATPPPPPPCLAARRPWRVRAEPAKQGSAPFCSLCSNGKWGPRVRG